MQTADGVVIKDIVSRMEIEIATLKKNIPTTPCDLCLYSPPSSTDGKPCSICPATPRTS